ncbi:BMP family lipoprotein [Roseibium sediminicola]|uniref:BMP family ABC transporter substrate-binding protein n=1 Tax=Roseibium sediminicola TaxID=2933272 RepID=A0ABT0GZ78_9HYPH|nr:BMP family ABC transporter substrate-binding protein [Roseibium sp. CAU 1639]MCK7614737.1 BMP family ABC transporter substrate-binding protein [Roseibium sp. CAU 1639]
MIGNRQQVLAVIGVLCLFVATPALAQTSGAILFAGTKNDGSFNELAHLGTSRAIGDFGLDIDEWVTVDEEETLNVLRMLAKRGANHLVTLGFANTNAVRTAAVEFPDVSFTLIDGMVADLPNVRSILFSEQQSGFIAGYVAGLKSRTGKVGTIGGTDIPPVRRFMCGFAAGAKHANSQTQVVAAFVGADISAFRDIIGGKQIAEKMLAEGVDVIFAPAGLAAEGVAKAAEGAGAHVIMVDANRNDFIPGTVLTSALKRVDEAAFSTWEAVSKGTWEAGVLTMSVSDNGVDWSVDQYNKALVADIEGKVNETKEELASGHLKIEPVTEIEGCDQVF